jgi:hypothetical protein
MVVAEAVIEKSPLTEVRVGEPVTNKWSTFKSMVVNLAVWVTENFYVHEVNAFWSV